MVDLRKHLTLAFAAVFIFGLSALAGDDWKPVDPAELAMKSGKVDKDADAEGLFCDIRVADQAETRIPISVRDYYMRIKVFTDRGKDEFSQIRIPYINGTTIKDVAARTIKPDGTIIEVRKEDIFDRTEAKLSGLKTQIKSFAMPGLEPGAIIEYRWREERVTNIYFRLALQLDDIPVEKVTCLIKPLRDPHFQYGFKLQTFHTLMQAPFKQQPDGYVLAVFQNMPAFIEEPHMPPNDQERAFLLVSYTQEDDSAPAQYWKAVGKRLYDENKQALKPNDEVKKAAATAVGDASTNEQKLDRIFDFCHKKIKNISDAASGISPEDLAAASTNKTPGDTLKNGIGTARDINLLFGAMAAAAGFEVRAALLGDRSDIFFDAHTPSLYFLDSMNIAVRSGDGWLFFAPGSKYVQNGMLAWQQEGEQALVTDPKEPGFFVTPLSSAQTSLEKRTAKLKLTDDGTVEGDVRIEFTGHMAADRRRFDSDDSQLQREKDLTDSVKKRLSTAEVSKIRIENFDDLEKPYVYEYHIKVPGYAARTGKRLLLQPAFFESGDSVVFSGTRRIHPIYFIYPWSEEDHVFYDLPTGFQLDSPEAPAALDAPPLAHYSVTIKTNPENTLLEYTRSFMFGGGGHIVFPVENYAQIKAIFEGFSKRDNHTILLKQGVTAGNANGN